MTDPATAPPGGVSGASAPVGRTLGATSVWLWAGAFAIGGAATAAFFGIPNDASLTVHNIATAIFLVVVLVLVPVAHVAGLVSGLIAAFRPARGRGLGIVGALLNGLTIAGAAIVMLAVLSFGAAFR